MVNVVSRAETKILVASILTLVFSISALVSLIFGGDQLTHDLKDLDGLHTLPKPCGIATPNVEELTKWTAMLDSNVVMPVGASDAASRLKSRMCEQVTVEDAVDKFYGGDAGNGSVAAFEEHVCSKRDADGIYDPLRRLSRAYLRASTAFARVSSGECVWDSGYPFDSSACPSGKLVRDQMMQATMDPVMRGYVGQMPSSNTILYRVSALAVLAYYDRTNNQNGCFGNIKTPIDTVALCRSVFNKNPPPHPPPNTPAASPPPPKIPNMDSFFFDVYDNAELLARCENKKDSTVLLQPPPSPPPPPSSPAVAFHDELDTTLTDDERQCVRQHTFALYDVETLYNMPNFNEPPRLKEPSPNTFVQSDFLYKALYGSALDAWFNENRRDKVIENQEREIMIFSSFRVAIGLYWVLWGISVTMWWISYAGLPAVVITVEVLGRFSSARKTPPKQASIARPELGSGMVLAIISSLLYVCWVFLVHPFPNPTAPRLDLDCDDFKTDGSVYSTTRAARNAAAVAAVCVLLSTGTSLLYMFLLKSPDTKPPRTASSFLQILAIAIAIAMIVLEAYILQDSMGQWVEKVRDVEEIWSMIPEKRQMVENDIRVLIATTVGCSAAASGLNNRYVFNNRGKGKRSLYILTVATMIWMGRISKLSIHGDMMYAEVNGVYTSGTRRAFDRGVLAAECSLSLVFLIIAMSLWSLKQLRSKALITAARARKFTRVNSAPMPTALPLNKTFAQQLYVDPLAPPSHVASDDENTSFIPSLCSLR